MLLLNHSALFSNHSALFSLIGKIEHCGWIASYPGCIGGGGKRKKEPGTHRSRMRLIKLCMTYANRRCGRNDVRPRQQYLYVLTVL